MKVFNLPEGWKFVSLYDLVDVIGGVSYSPEDITSSGVRVIRGGNIQGNLVELRDDDVFLPDTYKNSDNSLHKGDVILVASTGSVEALGRTATVWENMENVQIGAFLRILRPKQPKYAALVSAWLSSEHYFRYIRLVAKGTSINNISLNHIKGFKIPIPSDEKATSFTALYNAVAKKININRAINQNLEALAKQIYDYWFVQFDFPNEEGKPYKSSGGKMVYNKTLKREIPKGWGDGKLIDIANITMGQSPDGSSYNKDGDGVIFYQGSTDFGIRFPEVRQYSTAPTRFANKGDILMSVRAPVGAINFANNDCCIGRGLCAMNSKIGSVTHLYHTICVFKEKFERASQIGTTFGSITKDELYSLPVVIPHESIVSKYERLCSPIFDRQMGLGVESVHLTSLRDYLIPLLMNGQVTIKEYNQI